MFEPLQPSITPFDDPGDRLLPGGTYIDDFVMVTKGMATPTRLCIWAALSQISAVLKRDAWLQWYPGRFYGNLYVVVVGPPRWNAKSTIIDDYTDPILRGFVDYLPRELQARKTPQIFHSKVTPEGLFHKLTLPTKVLSVNAEGREVEVTIPWSNATLLMSELGTFLGRQDYNEGLIQKLTDLYSCKAEDDETTKGGGTVKVRDTYVTLLGATTPVALEACLPEAAFSDGFLSRLILVKGYDIIRKWPRPFEVVKGACQVDQGGHYRFPPLEERLAWLASTHRGEYTLDDEARAGYDSLHDELVAWNEASPDYRESAVKSRMDLNVLKVSLLMRCARYEPGSIITLRDFNAAKVIVLNAYEDAFSTIANVGATPEVKQIEQVIKYLRSKKSLARMELVRRFSSKHGKTGINAKVLSGMLSQLLEEGNITVEVVGHRIDRLTEKTTEVYTWTGGALRGDDDATS